jgi:hypothetical protein
MPLLVLFDVDGTLFLTHDALSGQALRETLEAHFGVDLPEDAVERVPHPGQTSLKIARLVLHDAASTITPSRRVFGPGARSSPRATSSCSATRTRAPGKPLPERLPPSRACKRQGCGSRSGLGIPSRWPEPG